jgi:hypothetical protein
VIHRVPAWSKCLTKSASHAVHAVTLVQAIVLTVVRLARELVLQRVVPWA